MQLSLAENRVVPVFHFEALFKLISELEFLKTADDAHEFVHSGRFDAAVNAARFVPNADAHGVSSAVEGFLLNCFQEVRVICSRIGAGEKAGFQRSLLVGDRQLLRYSAKYLRSAVALHA